MARPREFDQTQVMAQARALFASQGYNGTSIDDLVKTTGLLRGSLYKAFGSKRNIFLALLQEIVEEFESSAENLDLLTVALKDLAPYDKAVRNQCIAIIGSQEKKFVELLGKNIVTKMKEK